MAIQNNKNFMTKFLWIFIFITGFIVGFLFQKFTENTTSLKETRMPRGYTFISPLLECEGFDNHYTQTAKLKHQLEESVEDLESNTGISDISIYYRDLNNGPWVGINEQELFSPASLIKVPLLIGYLKSADIDPKILERTLTTPALLNYTDQNFIPTNKLSSNTEYTVLELLRQMIQQSDNNAYDMLLSAFDNNELIEIYQELGVDISRAKTDPAGNILTLRNYASFFRILYNSTYLSPVMSEKALFILSATNFENGIDGGIPNNVLTAHKFGERLYVKTGEKQLHDCGIVYATIKPYLLCIMTRGTDFYELSKAIQEVSRITYSFVTSK